MNGGVGRHAIARYDWPRDDEVASRGHWRLFTHDPLDYLAVWVDAEEKRMAISFETWEMLVCDEMAIAQFFKDMAGGATGMKFIVASAGPYAAAVRKQGQGQGVVDVADPVAALLTAANNLVVQAASMNRQPTALQQSIFAERYARLRAELDAVHLRVEQARAALDLAGTALYDATQMVSRSPA